MKPTVLVFVLAGLLDAAGCGTMAPFADPVAKPGQGASYVYGRFERVETPADPGVNKIGLVITSLDGKREYAFCFRKKQAVFAIAVEPGDYEISKWVCTYGFSNEISNEQPISADGDSCRFSVHAGSACYLGDYRVSKTIDAMSSLARNRPSYFLDAPMANYETATRDLDEQYPGFHEIAKVPAFGERRPFDIARSIQIDQSAVGTTMIVPIRCDMNKASPEFSPEFSGIPRRLSIRKVFVECLSKSDSPSLVNSEDSLPSS